ncbi:MAG: helix-turn-helix domain-containing protein, partial [Eubacterium sp.]|nr:helix-turn-helix domain-containing protein [Eubacterium sp.]
MTIGEKIKFFREMRGYNLSQLGKLSKLEASTIRKYEQGERNPKPDQLAKIAAGLNLSVSIFYDLNIETAGDVASLFFLMDDKIEFIFEGKKEDGTYDEDSVSIKFKNKSLQKFLMNWATIKAMLDNIEEQAADISNESVKKTVREEKNSMYEKFKCTQMDSPLMVTKD